MGFNFKRSAFTLALTASLAASAVGAAWADSPSEKRETIHRCLLQIYTQQHRAEAGGEYKALIAIKPSDAQLRFDYGNFLFRSGNYAGAAGEYRAAIAKQGRNSNFQIGLGNALMHTKDYRGAVVAYRKAVEYNNATGSQNAGALLQSAQQYVQQQEAYDNYKKQQAENQ